MVQIHVVPEVNLINLEDEPSEEQLKQNQEEIEKAYI